MSASLWEHLAGGLVDAQGLRSEVAAAELVVARHLLAEGIDPAPLEIAAEDLARWAARLAEDTATAELILSELVWLELASTVTDLVRAAVPAACGRVELAALAVHLLGIAEQMALELYVAELPALLAKSDRSGEAARRVGAARHLRG